MRIQVIGVLCVVSLLTTAAHGRQKKRTARPPATLRIIASKSKLRGFTVSKTLWSDASPSGCIRSDLESRSPVCPLIRRSWSAAVSPERGKRRAMLDLWVLEFRSQKARRRGERAIERAESYELGTFGKVRAAMFPCGRFVVGVVARYRHGRAFRQLTKRVSASLPKHCRPRRKKR